MEVVDELLRGEVALELPGAVDGALGLEQELGRGRRARVADRADDGRACAKDKGSARGKDIKAAIGRNERLRLIFFTHSIFGLT